MYRGLPLRVGQVEVGPGVEEEQRHVGVVPEDDIVLGFDADNVTLLDNGDNDEYDDDDEGDTFLRQDGDWWILVGLERPMSRRLESRLT